MGEGEGMVGLGGAIEGDGRVTNHIAVPVPDKATRADIPMRMRRQVLDGRPCPVGGTGTAGITGVWPCPCMSVSNEKTGWVRPGNGGCCSQASFRRSTNSCTLEKRAAGSLLSAWKMTLYLRKQARNTRT